MVTTSKNPKNRKDYEQLLRSFPLIQLKRLEKLMDLFRMMWDLVREHDLLVVGEESVKSIGFSMEQAKDIYIDLSTKKFEVFIPPNTSNPVYPIAILPNPFPVPGATTMSSSMNIQLFPKEDPRRNNFRTFLAVLTDIIYMRDTPGNKTVITKDEATGDFYYRDKIMEFNDKKTIYHIIVECLYEKADGEGFCSYKLIDKYLVSRGQEERATDEEKRKRITNGVSNLFRFSDFPKTIGGRISIRKVRGEGLILYNPLL